MNLPELPHTWTWGSLESLVVDPKNDIVDGPFGSNLKASEYVEAGVPIIRLQNVSPNQFIYKNIRFITEEKAAELNRHSFRPGDIVITKLGDPLGEACIVPDELGSGIIVADIVRVRLSEKANKKAIVYAINSPAVQSQLKAITKGTTRPRVNLGQIRLMLLPIPPRNEQDDIVAEIEKQFTRLDDAVVSLKRAHGNLQLYRTSMLNAACRGRLVPTEAKLASTEGRAYEPASELLKRILDERRTQWESDQLQKMVAAGKSPKNDKWKENYQIPPAPDTTTLTNLPQGWVWSNIGQLAKVGTGATPKRDTPRYYEGGSIPWVTSSVVNQEFVSAESELVTHAALRETNLTLYPKNTLILAMYGEGKTRGKVSELLIEATTNQALAAIQLEGLAAKCRPFVKLALKNNYESIRRGASGGVQPNLNLDLVRAVPVPIAPLAEQFRIVEAAAAILTNIEHVETEINQQFGHAVSLYRAIMSQAFLGKLVPQNPNDEPASVLIKNIAIEQAARKPEQRLTRKNPMKKEKEQKTKALIDTLKTHKSGMSPERLFAAAGHTAETIDNFYAELKAGIVAGLIEENRAGIRITLRAR
jgi:type I restriction enzyme S subunit